MKKQKRRLVFLEIFAILLGLFFVIPIVLIIVNSFKTNGEIMGNFFGFLPTGFHIENYLKAWEKMKYPLAFKNTLILTVGSALGTMIFGSMAAYKLCRTKTKYSRIIFLICISPMMIAFSSIMISLTKVAKMFHLINSIYGLIVIYWGLLLPFTIFLYHGNFKTVPLEIEEAARIDGCGSYRAFVYVVFPMLKPITTTVCIINGMKIWNDLLTPMIMIGASSKTRTLVLAAEQFKGVMTSNYALSMSAFIMTSIPLIVFYLCMQQYIVGGITVGAVKG